MNKDHFDILKVSSRAKMMGRLTHVIDASVGMLFDEEAKLFSFKSVKTALKILAEDYNLAYQSSCGDEILRSSVKEYLIRTIKYSSKSEFNVFLTVGGTGALTLVKEYLQTKNYILPDMMWPNYLNIFEVDSPSVYKVDDVNSIESAFEKIDPTRGEPVIVINDPAQNPTGFSLSAEDYNILALSLNKRIKTTSFSLILDLAYLDYGSDSSLPFKLIDQLDDRIKVFIILSASKSFGIYGLRAGALLTRLSFEPEHLIKFQAIARKLYSCPPSIGFRIIDTIIQDQSLFETYLEELNISRSMLTQRAEVLLAGLSKEGISYATYKEGFYLTLCDIENSYSLCEKLEAQNVYLVPINETQIRIALCSLSIEDAKILPRLIKEAQHD